MVGLITMQLNKYVALSGISSRRQAAMLVQEGQITINHAVVTDPSYKVRDNDTVRYGKKVLKVEEKVYILLNKPVDYVTTLSDEKGRKTVLDCVRGASKSRIYPVGRLDRLTTGLLLLTNDGDCAQKLSHPRHRISKVYQVMLDKPLTDEDKASIAKGVRLEDGVIKVDKLVTFSHKGSLSVTVTIHSGKNRVVRRLFEQLGYRVKWLDRVQYAWFTKKGLPCGSWRFLDSTEIKRLQHLLLVVT